MRWVDDATALSEVAAAVEEAPEVYLDTEFESSRQGCQLSLLQLTSGTEVYVVDALRLASLRPLAGALGRPGVTWVLHAGSQDVPLITRALELEHRPRIFDTQVAWSLLSPEYSVSLAYLLHRVLGVKPAKGHQADDWLRRPLPKGQLAYAAADVEHLPALYRALTNVAEGLARREIIVEASAEAVWPGSPPPAPKLALESFRNAWLLDATGQAGLVALIDWHNSQSSHERDEGPEAKVLLSIAGRMPESVDDLGRIKGVPRRWAERHGRQVVTLLREARRQADSGAFRTLEPAPYATFEQIRLEAWLGWARAELCTSLRVSPEAALPQKVVRDIRDAILGGGGPKDGVQGLTGWRRSLLHDAYLDCCARAPTAVEVRAEAADNGGVSYAALLRDKG